MKKDIDEKESPFFTRFLEGQQFPQIKTSIKAGTLMTTNKFPSDLDEPEHTLKYPSDGDEV